MKNKKKVSGVLSIVIAVLIAIGSVGFLFSFFKGNKEEPSYSSSSTSSVKLYSHHFDVIFEASYQTSVEGTISTLGSSTVHGVWIFNFNCISNNSTPYETLGDLEGDGYIVSAFGKFSVRVNDTLVPTDICGECRTVYNGSIFYYYMDLPTMLGNDGAIHYGHQFSMANYVLEDSVSRI